MTAPLAFYAEGATRGGAEIAMRHLLAALDPSLSVRLVGTDPSLLAWLAEARPGTPTSIVPMVRSKADLRQLLALRRELVALGPAVLHVNLAAIDGARFVLLAAATVPQLRVVRWVHSPIQAGGSWSLRLAGLLSRRAAVTAAVGSSLVRDLEALPAARPGSVRHVPVGLPVSVAAPRSLGLDRPVVGSVARLVPGKRLDSLVEAFADAVQDGQQGSLVVVGEGPEREALEALVRRRGIEHRVHLVGWKEDAGDWLAAFDLFVLPSAAEGLPLTIIEALRAGVPVVATDVGSVGDVVVAGKTGVLVPPGDREALTTALRDALADPASGSRMAEEGRALTLRRFTVEGAARSFEAIYDEVMAR